MSQTPSQSPAPLEGVRVLDLTRVLAGPFTGRLLAEMGAEVVKLEPPGQDLIRWIAPAEDRGMSGLYTLANLGKRNICVDLSREEGREIALDLVRWADAVPQRFISDVGNAGVLAGMRGVGSGIGLDVVPSLSLGYETGIERPDSAAKQRVSDFDAKPSGDLIYKLLPSLTADGFRVVPTPELIHARLQGLFDEGMASAEPEEIDDAYLPSGAPLMIPTAGLGEEIQRELQGLHEQWAGCPLVPTAAYGLRVYQQGHTLRRHCDRVETHVVSSVVHIADDVDEPWPLTIDDASGRRHEVYLEPGQTLLYESAKLPHGRLEPLPGRYYASLFLHYRPVDWSQTLDELCRSAAVGRGVRAGR